jgi:hypothetical protein
LDRYAADANQVEEGMDSEGWEQKEGGGPGRRQQAQEQGKKEEKTEKTRGIENIAAEAQGKKKATQSEERRQIEKREWREAVKELGGVPDVLKKSHMYQTWLREGKLFADSDE